MSASAFSGGSSPASSTNTASKASLRNAPGSGGNAFHTLPLLNSMCSVPLLK